MNEYRLEVGRVVLGLKLPSAQRAHLERYFGRETSARTPDVHLKVRPVRHGLQRSIPESLYRSKSLTGERFEIADGLIRGTFRAVSADGWVRVPRWLLEGQLTRVFEQLLYQAFYSGCTQCGYDACLLHAAAVTRNGAGFVFVGASGAGKSTVAALSAPGSVLNDEISLLEFAPEGVLLRDTPFNGLYQDKVRGCVPLRAVFLLEQASEHRIVDLSAAQAGKRLFSQLAPPVGLEQALGGDSIGRMLEITERLLGRIPVRGLRFRRDPGFWAVIERAFPGGKP